jgi:hypothetical protein
MDNQADREDLQAEIDELFCELVSEYNPNRGVDFPYFIKKMLDLRTYHFVTKYLKNVNNESYSAEELVIEDDSYKEIFEKIIELNSLDPNIQLGEKHRRLMVGILIEGKTLKELADEEGVLLDRIHARLYFLIRKMKKNREQEIAQYGKDMY